MAKTLKMTFRLEGGKTTSVSLPAPKDDIKADDVRGVMNTFVTKEALIVNGKKAEGAKEAVVREVTEVKLF